MKRGDSGMEREQIRISVRNLVEFILRSGDIDNRRASLDTMEAMQAGSRLHRKIQKKMGSTYHAEVPLNIIIEEENYELGIWGRADGIIIEETVTIDEIKGVYLSLDLLEEPVKVHLAQAKCYAYIYGIQNDLQKINVQMTYGNLDTGDLKYFSYEYSMQQLQEWFSDLILKYKKWADFQYEWRKKRQASIKELAFPFPYREGQKELAAGVYRTIARKKNLFIQAPTGVGKTISTLYPAIKAVGEGLGDKIFYLTAKTVTANVAKETLGILCEKGYRAKSVQITAKEKLCPCEEVDCNPVSCPYAKGHFDRVNDAVYDLLQKENNMTREVLLAHAKEYQVCPFEMCLDTATWADNIICDYNYVFDPDASLKRYFGNGAKGDYVFLVDEAHNLVDRAREMYSAVLKKEDFLAAKKLVKEMDKRLAGALDRCNKQLLEYKRQCDTFMVVSGLGTFPASLERVMGLMQKFMERHKGEPVTNELLEFFFAVRHFLNMYDCADEKYVYYNEHDNDGNFLVHLYCVDPSGNISERLSQGRSTVFFSATLLPVNYFKEMLSGDVSDRAVYAHSSFEPDNKRIVVATDVTSRYTRRNVREYAKVHDYIMHMISGRSGRYMVFFPSYSYMESVLECFRWKSGVNVTECGGEDTFLPEQCINVLVQGRFMKEADKENFLSAFYEELPEGASLAGFCVLGGIFSEGIDLKDESLIGAVIVGTGIPMVCRERNILRDYFDEFGKNGYSYAYVIPGMNKVLQAAGRVIRTDTDKGVIALLDDRFMTGEYESMYPREWNRIYPVTLGNADRCIRDFWNEQDL